MKLPHSKITSVISFACFIDLFAVALLVFASKHQPYRETLPLVAVEDRSSENRDEIKPMFIEIDRDGQWTIDRAVIDLNSLIETIKESHSDQKILVAMECDPDGRGAVTGLLQLTHRGQQLGFANRLYVLTQDPNSKASRNP
jgi:biopolymer transport protein ExbD